MSATWSDAPMPPASSGKPPTIEELLERLLTGERGDRAKALLAAINVGIAGQKVADYRCGSHGDPVVFTFRQLCRHVFAEDHPRRVEERGYRLHTPVNVVLWNEELGGHGPAFKRGPS